MSPTRRGSTLVAVLLVLSLLLVSGLGLLSRKSLEYDRVAEEVLDAQALTLARSGLEDVLIKYARDPDFPPLSGQDQNRLTYTEMVYRTDGTTLVGSYTVTLDTRLATNRSWVALIQSVGTVGPESKPSARHSVSAELNLNPGQSTYFQLINFQDHGSVAVSP